MLDKQKYEHGEQRTADKRKHNLNERTEMPRAVDLSRFGERPRQTLEGRVEHEEVDAGILAFHNAHADKVVPKTEEVSDLDFGSERADNGQKHNDDSHTVDKSFTLEIVFRDGVSGDYLRSHAEQRHKPGVQ